MVTRAIQQNTSIRDWLRGTTRVFTAVESGRFELPPDVQRAREAFEDVLGAIAGISMLTEEDAASSAAQELADKVGSGAIPNDLGKQMTRAEDRNEDARRTMQVLRVLEAQRAADLTHAFADNAEDFVVDCLRPVLAEVVERTRELAPMLQGVATLDQAARLTEGRSEAIDAWSELEGLHVRYLAIRAAYDATFAEVFSSEIDTTAPDMGGLVRYRNFYALDRDALGVPTMPEQPAAAMVWLAGLGTQPDPEVWLPLPDEIQPALEAAKTRTREMQQQGFVERAERKGRIRQRERDEQDARDAAQPVGGLRQKPAGW